MASPSSLPSHTVFLALQYIAPPSSITQPLPPHLLSRALLQRHHFLGIASDDAQEYLCWPSSLSDVRERVIALLEDLPRIEPEDAHYDVQYTSDEESTYAHAHIPSDIPSDGDGDLRLVFQWDGDEWKYHDAALMPFPTNSRPDLELPPAASLVVPQSVSSSAESSEVRDDDPAAPTLESDDDDDYWNSYGAGDDGEEESIPHRATNATSTADTNMSEEEAAEAAYWAQYSSVHGTADSTIPSPLPAHRRQVLQPQTRPSDSGDTDPQIVHFPPRDCPSPVTLSNLLRNASPRDSFSEPYSLPTSPPFEGSEVTVQILDSTDADGDSSDGSSEDTKILSPKVESPAAEQVASDEKSPIVNREDGVEAALKASITGVYQLWKSTRPADAATEQDRKEEFLRVVRDMVIGLP
ncbi:hypothetical protein OE88DRAFT_1730661 [Heliocybe sulcata]|uniref:Uncharacterized protein n=1 Tax=Heliocybe sulcata TaxID=5364 RepID=A0A5C3NHT0_9AGAM|nr:hypothetical protein OE88DRAFT_1730661 [Heliocybe sulcata]